MPTAGQRAGGNGESYMVRREDRIPGTEVRGHAARRATGVIDEKSLKRLRDLAEDTARLLIVDDHAFIREGIKAIVGRDASLEVVGEAQDGEEAIACCRELRPDLVLMDVSMPRMNGIEATSKIKAQFPETSVLILTAHADHRLATRRPTR